MKRVTSICLINKNNIIQDKGRHFQKEWCVNLYEWQDAHLEMASININAMQANLLTFLALTYLSSYLEQFKLFKNMTTFLVRQSWVSVMKKKANSIKGISGLSIELHQVEDVQPGEQGCSKEGNSVILQIENHQTQNANAIDDSHEKEDNYWWRQKTMHLVAD